MTDLQRAYKLIHHEVKKAEHRIDWIDGILSTCGRVSAEYWRDTRARTVAYLDGLYKAYDIIFKEIHK